MGFNPLGEKGIPIERQFQDWSALRVEPYPAWEVDPYTRCRVITLDGLEIESIMFSHQFARHTDNPDIKAHLALLRRIEQQQQKVVSGLIPAEESILEVTIGYEQVAVDLTAFLARSEPDPYLKQVLDFGLLEDFDHLYRYANLLDLVEGKSAQAITWDYTEIMPGRPTIAEHRHPFDDVRAHYDRNTVDPLSRLHVLTILAAEQQTMNFYMTVMNRLEDPLARSLYAEIAQIEEQHVTQYESLLDPLETWLQQELFHHYNECYLYYSFLQQETDIRLKGIWERHLNMEVEHVRIAGELLERYEGIEPAEILPKELPEPTLFQSNKEYVRQVLKSQVDLRTLGPQFVSLKDLPRQAPYFLYQKQVNAGGFVPSEAVVQEHERAKGHVVLLLTEGPAPEPARAGRGRKER